MQQEIQSLKIKRNYIIIIQSEYEEIQYEK